MAGTQIVTYRVDAHTTARFEFEPGPGYTQVASGNGHIVASVTNAVTPALAAAKAVLHQVAEVPSQTVEMRFGVRVTGDQEWVVARSVDEGTFEVTVTWRPTG